MDRSNGWHKPESVGYLVLSGAEGEMNSDTGHFAFESDCSDEGGMME
jgi:hypothetical protein